MRLAIRRMAAALLLMSGLVASVAAQTDSQTAAVAWRLLDYLSVDYGGIVADNGHVVSQSEYAEMVEFAQQARDRLTALPITPRRPSLFARSRAGIESRQIQRLVRSSTASTETIPCRALEASALARNIPKSCG